jgi:chitin synthase
MVQTAEFHTQRRPLPAAIPSTTDADIHEIPAVAPEVLPRATNAVCITVYNESAGVVRETLASILENCQRFHGAQALSGSSALCLIFDGRDRADRGTLEWLSQCGLLERNPRREADGTEFHLTSHTYGDLLDALDVRGGLRFWRPLCGLQVIVCLKNQNRGKLQSHAIFFDELCPSLRSPYCYQVDAGTTLDPDAIGRLVDYLEQRRDLAAVAPCVTTPVPAAGDPFIVHWQFFDFAFRAAAVQPLEFCAGHLSVVPGQACVIRWEALRGSEQASQAPLRAYLDGLQAAGSLTRLMFLAEDRVMGTHLVMADHQKWRIGYLSDIKAVTDACRTPTELLRQRRRWNNSTIACRLWLIGSVSEVLRDAQGTPDSKLRFCGTALVQSLLGMREFFAPAQLAALLALLIQATLAAGGPFAFVLCGAFWLAVAGEGLMVSRGEDAEPGAARVWRRARASLRVTSAVTLPLMLWQIADAPAIAVLAAPLLVIPPAFRLFKGRARLALLQSILSPVHNLAVTSSLTLYSMWNLHDVSWGTKGLVGAGALRAASRLHRWRAVAMLVWAVANGALAVAALLSTGWVSAALNPLVEASCLTYGLVGIVGYFFLRARARSRS